MQSFGVVAQPQSTEVGIVSQPQPTGDVSTQPQPVIQVTPIAASSAIPNQPVLGTAIVSTGGKHPLSHSIIIKPQPKRH